MKELSIIIPVYKAEYCLSNCLDSVLKQLDNNDNVEIICVNDGSPDASAEVIKQYQNRYKNIVILEQENRGVSVARNNGILKASGKYLAFLDADDELISGSIPSILKIIKQTNDDIIVCRMFQNDDEFLPWKDKLDEGVVYTANEMINRGYLHGTSCGCIIKHSIIKENKISFPVGVYNGEDGFFFHTCLYYSGNVRFENVKMYNILGAEGSLSRTYNRERVQRMVSSLSTVEETLNRYTAIVNREFILDYIKYSILSGLITTTVYTKDTGLFFLLKHNCNHIIKMKLDDNVVFLRRKMSLLQHSFVFYYLLAWTKKILNHFHC